MTRISLVHGRVRAEEKMLVDAASRLDIELETVHDNSLVFDLDGGGLRGDAILQRCVSATRGLYVARAANAAGIPCFNDTATTLTCMDKAETSWRLRGAGVRTPETRVAFDPESALAAFEQVGYPAVLKPTQGSWARLVARVNDADEAQQLLEHRLMLPNPLQHIVYIQEYVDKGSAGMHRDLRAFVVGDQTIAAVWRSSPHWVTNTARGATTQNCPIDDELNDICLRAAEAVGGGILAVDLMPTPDGPTVHEINHTMEFRNSVDITGVDIPGAMLQYCVQEARR